MKVAILIFIALLLVAIYPVAYRGSKRTETFKVTNLVTKGSSGKYMVFTDHGVRKDTDTVLFGKFNSSDLFGQLKIGHTYTCTEAGWRYHLSSSYPNLLSCKEDS